MSTNKPCEKYADILVLYHYGELDPGVVKQVQTHLASCEACRTALEELGGALNSFPAYEPSQGDVQRAVRGVMEKISPQRRPREWKLAFTLATAAGLVLALVFTYHERPAPVKEIPGGQVAVADKEIPDSQIAAADKETSGKQAMQADAETASEQVMLAEADIEMLENYDLLKDMDVLEEMELMKMLEEAEETGGM